MIEQLLIVVLLTFLVVCTIGIIYLRDLLAAVILLGIYSLTAAGIFIVMDAVDVAFTEAAVGAGISTILLLACLSHTEHVQKPQKHKNYWAMGMVCITGILLIYGTLDMPRYGDALSPAQSHPDLAQRFINESGAEVGVPNIVTSVLASYRGYDTLGETVVVFSAGIAVLALLGRKRRRTDEDDIENEDDLLSEANAIENDQEADRSTNGSDLVQRMTAFFRAWVADTSVAESKKGIKGQDSRGTDA